MGAWFGVYSCINVASMLRLTVRWRDGVPWGRPNGAASSRRPFHEFAAEQGNGRTARAGGNRIGCCRCRRILTAACDPALTIQRLRRGVSGEAGEKMSQ